LRGCTLISALLVLALLPVDSFGAICELTCCPAVIPKLMSSMERASAHRVSLIDHHQHHRSNVRQSTPNQNAATAAGAQEKPVAIRTCCASNQTISSASCAARNQNALQSPITAPKSDINLAVLLTQASIHFRAIQDSNRSDALRTPVRGQSPGALTLRI